MAKFWNTLEEKEGFENRVLELYQGFRSQYRVAEELGCSQSLVSRIVRKHPEVDDFHVRHERWFDHEAAAIAQKNEAIVEAESKEGLLVVTNNVIVLQSPDTNLEYTVDIGHKYILLEDGNGNTFSMEFKNLGKIVKELERINEVISKGLKNGPEIW